MTKRIFTIGLSILMLFAWMPIGAFYDVADDAPYSQAIDHLASLGIIAGYPDGNFHPKEPLTRAQFAKMVIVTTGNDEAALSKTTEVFTDVPVSHWGIGFINEAAQQGLITGYPDGSFGPEEQLTYAQALTIAVRMLGYSVEEVGTNWPFDYIHKASELGLTKQLRFQNSDIVTREVAAYILDASLTAKAGNGSQLSTFTKVEDVVLYGTSETSASIKSNEVLTTGGTFKRGTIHAESYLGKTVTLRVNNEREIKMVSVTSETPDSVVLLSAYQDEILTADGRHIAIDKQKPVYYEGVPTTYAAVYASLLQGSKMDVYDDYLYIEKTTLDGPYTFLGDDIDWPYSLASSDVSAVTIDGVTASLSDLKAYDIVYFNHANNRVYAYSKRITGIYDKAIPSKDNLQSITVSGITYTDISSTAKAKLDDSDEAYKINDQMTLLFGYNGEVADVIVDEPYYTIESLDADKIRTSEAGVVEVKNNTTVCYDGVTAPYASMYQTIVSGSRAYIYDDYIFVAKNTLIGPFTFQGDRAQMTSYFGDLSHAAVTIDGEEADMAKIKKFDVVYYNEITDRLYVYTTRVTGFYEKALPSKDNLQSVTVSGINYSNLSLKAKTKLDDSAGAFKMNDRITLLFGNDGSVVDVVDENGRTLYDMGVILKTYTKISTDSDTAGKEEYYADLMLGSGNTVSYKTDKQYKDTDRIQYTGSFVYITGEKDGTVSLKRASENLLTGSFDKSIPSYAGHDLQQNYTILECLYSEKYDEAIVEKVNLRDITQSALSASQVLHVEYANDMEDIALLYIKDVTYDGYTFGILNKATKDENANYIYELKAASGTVIYTGNAGWGFTQGEAVMAMTKGGKIKTIRPLKPVESGSEIESYTTSKIKMNHTVYHLWEAAPVVYKKTGEANWNVTTLEDLSDHLDDGTWAVNQITLYSDKQAEGKIRVIRVTLKG